MKRIGLGLAMTAAVLAVAGCYAAKKPAEQRSAAGEVLSGSISDAMIPYEQLKSQPPLAPERIDKPASAAVAGDVPEAADSAADATSAVSTADPAQ